MEFQNLIENGGDFTLDTDGDGIPDQFDLDSDGDGINDVVESGSGELDADGDGVIDGADTGSGSNGLFDGVEDIPESGNLDYTHYQIQMVMEYSISKIQMMMEME